MPGLLLAFTSRLIWAIAKFLFARLRLVAPERVMDPRPTPNPHSYADRPRQDFGRRKAGLSDEKAIW